MWKEPVLNQMCKRAEKDLALILPYPCLFHSLPFPYAQYVLGTSHQLLIQVCAGHIEGSCLSLVCGMTN